jgi:hypothetical protein
VRSRNITRQQHLDYLLAARRGMNLKVKLLDQSVHEVDVDANVRITWALNS